MPINHEPISTGVGMTCPPCDARVVFRHSGRPETGAKRRTNGVARTGAAKYGEGMGKLAVGYVRVSSHMQVEQGESLPAQRARLQAWATANDYELVTIYADEGISGASIDNRPGVLAAIEDVCKRKCPLVAVSASRVFRNFAQAAEISSRFQACGADLISLSEKIDTTSASGRLYYHLMNLLCQHEREQISERVASVLGHLRSQNRRISRYLPYGHTLAPDGEHLTPDPAEQSAIADICAWHEAGMSLRAIAQRLEETGIPSKGGGRKWRPGTIAAILRRQPMPTPSVV